MRKLSDYLGRLQKCANLSVLEGAPSWVFEGAEPPRYGLGSVSPRRVARIWKRGGGLFWKSEKCANDLDSNFHWSWISFRRIVRKLRRIVLESSEIQRFFPPELRWSPKKKKKGLRQNSEWFFGRNPKFKGFFLPKLGDLQKKKRSSPKLRLFHIKSASKAQKTCDFAYFTTPPLATLLAMPQFCSLYNAILQS